MHDLYIAEIHRPGAIFFTADNNSQSSFSCIPQASAEKVTVRYGGLRQSFLDATQPDPQVQ